MELNWYGHILICIEQYDPFHSQQSQHEVAESKKYAVLSKCQYYFPVPDTNYSLIYLSPP